MGSFFAPDRVNIPPGKCHNLGGVYTRSGITLQKLKSTCSKLNIRNCTNSICLDKRSKNELKAPECKSKELRDWVIVVVSCFSTNIANHAFKDDIRNRYEYAVFHALLCCQEAYRAMRDARWDKTKDEIEDLFAVCDLFYWTVPFGGDPKWMTRFFNGRELEVPAIRIAFEKLSSLSICQRRLWNLIQSSPRGIIDLPSLMPMLRRLPTFHHKNHNECRPDMCYFDDDNTTVVEQQHKDKECELKKCNPIYFDPGKLDDRIKIPQGSSNSPSSTAWSVDGEESYPSLLPPVSSSLSPVDRRISSYMAISHVWSDGTGQGSHRKGDVNRCLYDFFADIARKPPISCKGIWWDAICVPSDQKRRALAIERMHQNYTFADSTLVHDEELLKVPWSDDGTPCLALVLSTWFTRGWTALELKQSRRVKVLFRNPEQEGLVVKDLDNDILNNKDPYSMDLAHRVASTIISRLRGKPHFAIVAWTHTVSTLKSRYTSWARDRWIIPCLMECVEGFDATWSKTKMTKSLLLGPKTITATALLHGQTTMSDIGPWSWCPFSILDLQNAINAICLEIEETGAVIGEWRYQYLLDATKVNRLPAHISVRLKINQALQDSKKCLLLKPLEIAEIAHDYRCLLVVHVGTEIIQGQEVTCCQYIGAVEVQDSKGYLWKRKIIHLGCNTWERYINL